MHDKIDRPRLLDDLREVSGVVVSLSLLLLQDLLLGHPHTVGDESMLAILRRDGIRVHRVGVIRAEATHGNKAGAAVEGSQHVCSRKPDTIQQSAQEPEDDTVQAAC